MKRHTVSRNKIFHLAKTLTMLLCLAALLPASSVYAEETDMAPLHAASPLMNIAAEAAILYDIESNVILYEQNAKQRLAPASLTKLLAVLTACAHEGEAIRYTVGDEIDLVGSNSSTAYLRKSNVLSFEAIVDAVLLSSGNDATYTMAVNVARSATGQALSDTEALIFFAALMNETAYTIGCTDSQFVTVDGYPCADHYSTAYDMLRIAIEALNTPLVAKSISRSRAYHVFYSGREVIWETTNLLLRKDSHYYYAYATGMKTGSTGDQYSLAASAEKDGSRRIAIVMNAPSDTDRFETIVRLFEAGWE